MENAKGKRLVVNFTAVQIEQLNQLVEERGYLNMSEAVRRGVASLYQEEFKRDYMNVGEKRPVGRPRKSAEEKARNKIEAKKAEQEVLKEEREKEGVAICEQLNGKLTDSDGVKHCTYTTYQVMNPHLVNKGEFTMPINRLKPEDVVRQYKPDREACDAILNK